MSTDTSVEVKQPQQRTPKGLTRRQFLTMMGAAGTSLVTNALISNLTSSEINSDPRSEEAEDCLRSTFPDQQITFREAPKEKKNPDQKSDDYTEIWEPIDEYTEFSTDIENGILKVRLTENINNAPPENQFYVGIFAENRGNYNLDLVSIHLPRNQDILAVGPVKSGAVIYRTNGDDMIATYIWPLFPPVAIPHPGSVSV